MENLKETIVYVNIKGENGMREVREARFTKMQAEPCNIRLCNDMVYFFDGDFRIEIAGLGEMSNDGLLSLNGYMYSNMEDALNQRNEIASHINHPSIDVLWAKINASDLNFKHESVSVSTPYNNTYRPFTAHSWYWDGTKAVRKCVSGERKFYYNFLENRIVEYGRSEIDKLGTLYATKEMCEKANTPTIVRFDSKPKQVEKIVTFEITLGVTVGRSEMPECEEEDAIVAAMNRLRTCDDEVLFDACVSCTDMPSRK